MSSILVIRHGQSEWNELGKWQGQENPPLTDLGMSQAREAAQQVGDIDAVYSSPLMRAATTASIIAESIGVGPVQIIEDLMERHAGDWQGLTRDEINQHYPGYLDSGQRPPGWEDDDEVQARVHRGLRKIVAAHPGGSVLTVAHAGVLHAIERMFNVEWVPLPNLSGRMVHFDHDRGSFTLGDRIVLIGKPTIPGQI